MTNHIDAIYPLCGGTLNDHGVWRSTNYAESDAFGTLGGIARIQAAALLAQKYPDAWIVANAVCGDGRQPSHAQVHWQELQALGVAPERIVMEEKSVSTGSQVHEAFALARARGWHTLLLVSNEYHFPRIKAFCEREGNDVAVGFVSAESVLMQHDAAFAAQFEEIKKTSEYQKRLASEARGIEALKAGVYAQAPMDQKRERPA